MFRTYSASALENVSKTSWWQGYVSANLRSIGSNSLQCTSWTICKSFAPHSRKPLHTDMWTNAIYFHLLGTVPVWELEDIHTSYQNILLIFIRNLFLSVLYIDLSSEIVFFGFAALYCTSFWLLFVFFVVWCAFVASNKYYIHTYIQHLITSNQQCQRTEGRDHRQGHQRMTSKMPKMPSMLWH